MVTENSGIGERWSAIAQVAEAEQIQQMRAVLDEVLAMGEGNQAAALNAMVQAEYSLPDEQLRPFTVSRLRAWLAIAGDNMDGAKALAHGYDTVFDTLPADRAMHRSSTVQTVARTDLTPEEVTGLFDLIPSIVRQVPRATQPTRTYEKPEPQKKPFWKFW